MPKPRDTTTLGRRPRFTLQHILMPNDCITILGDSSVDRFRDLLGKSMDLIESQLRDPYTITSLRAARTLLTMSGVGKIAVPKVTTRE
jgi:hypothetical protein